MLLLPASVRLAVVLGVACTAVPQLPLSSVLSLTTILPASQTVLPMLKSCTLPASGTVFETALPEEVGLDPTALAKAVAYANTHNRISLQIFRHNCQVASGDLNPVTKDIPNNIWSCTKSVISLLTGIAYDMGKLQLTDEIGKYLPDKKGWGNPAHRAMTILDLLTETSGLQQSILAEAGTVGLDASAPQEALAQKLIYPPGTFFQYNQRVPDLMAYVVQRAVGMDLQAFAQKYLFDPIGIANNSYVWLRDRSGDTYGYAWLFLPPTQLAKLGLLLQHGGAWNGQRVVSAGYIANATAPSEHNPCYSWLFWNNAGQPCTSADIPAAQTFYRRAVPAAPPDMFAMVGALQQNNFISPYLDMTITWTGYFGDTNLNLASLASAAPGNLYDNFFSLLMKAVTNKKVPHKGFLKGQPLDLDVNPTNYINPAVLTADLISNPHCNVLFCRGGIPSKGVLENLQDIAILL